MQPGMRPDVQHPAPTAPGRTNLRPRLLEILVAVRVHAHQPGRLAAARAVLKQRLPAGRSGRREGAKVGRRAQREPSSGTQERRQAGGGGAHARLPSISIFQPPAAQAAAGVQESTAVGREQARRTTRHSAPPAAAAAETAGRAACPWLTPAARAWLEPHPLLPTPARTRGAAPTPPDAALTLAERRLAHRLPHELGERHGGETGSAGPSRRAGAGQPGRSGANPSLTRRCAIPAVWALSWGADRALPFTPDLLSTRSTPSPPVMQKTAERRVWMVPDTTAQWHYKPTTIANTPIRAAADGVRRPRHAAATAAAACVASFTSAQAGRQAGYANGR